MMSDLTGQFVLICVVVFIVFWIVKAFSTKRTIEATQSQNIWISVVIAIFVFLIGWRGRSLASGPPLWPHNLTTGLIADVVTFLGLLLTLWARVVLGGNWSSGVAFKEQHELIERGPYAHVRHPIYSGVLLMFLGIAIFRGSAAGFILLAIIVVGLWLKALEEEKLLTRHFGEAYPRYQKRVKALVPFLW
ncbi:MAG: hypothetical protein DMG15_26290 [Acidobacteria bacterium]|nr:MAG: hypothetical protein DMG16_26385 [Acidobacteriota bacterium]PYS08679.1 MAG: hypothetical protein DMG15_26290 [Acidobacteriota bacterium]